MTDEKQDNLELHSTGSTFSAEETLVDVQPRETADVISRERLLYKVSDRPRLHLSLLFALQQALLSLSGSVAISTLVADMVCASDIPNIKRELLSTTFFMNGITTLMMVTLGVRLPLFQGASPDYVIPLVALQFIDLNSCNGTDSVAIPFFTNDTSVNPNTTEFYENKSGMEIKREIAFTKLQEFQGCLILVGIFHSLAGMTGTAGYLIRFIGPLTVVPAMLAGSVYLARVACNYAKIHWGISIITFSVCLISSLYLGHKKMPLPAWSKSKGFFIYWYQLHQVFSILIGMLVGWFFSFVLTISGVLTNNKNDPGYLARTDARSNTIHETSWIYFPYPNQFGPPSFSLGVFVAFCIGTLTSILDSVSDYYACARVCNVPPPPSHAVNRGIFVEGFCSTISGALGCGHATSTYGGNIGAIGITKVASRDVFVWVAVIYLLFGVTGKISAIFITMPLPVLGGAMTVMYGILNGVVLSHIRLVSLTSNRNLAIIGIGFMAGIIFPYWVETHPNGIDTGYAYGDIILKVILSNPMLCTGLVACFLDNTSPGTDEDRGMIAWRNLEKTVTCYEYSEGLEVYTPLIPARWRISARNVMKYLPFCMQNARPGETNDV